jgi:hypothetical protein
MTCSRRRTLPRIAAAIFYLVPAVGLAITFPHTDDFQDGTTQNWTNGAGGAGIVNVASGGPEGAMDKFLQVSSGSFPLRPDLVTFNTMQWIGDYNSADVSAVSMDLKYISVGDPSIDVKPIRIALWDGKFLGYASADGAAGGAFLLPNDGQWHHWTFSLTDNAMVLIGGTKTLAEQLSNMQQFRILSSAVPSTQGDSLSVQLGIDNITAVPTLITGDFNRDSHFNVADIQAMAAALADLSGYQANWGLSDAQLLTLGNFNTTDMTVNNLDLQGLITALANGAGSAAPSAVPEPTTMALSIAGAAVLLALRFFGTGRRVGAYRILGTVA